MTETLQNKLIKSHKKIFGKNFYFECDDGWYELIFNLCEKIQQECDTSGCEQVKAAQVKEKFGSLRFYYSGGNDNVFNLTLDANKQSTTICEVTGNSGELHVKKGWYKTLCNESAILLDFNKVK